MFKVNSSRYVHYNESGQIEKISKDKDDRFDAIQTEFENVKGLIDGTELLINYRVEYDFLDKTYKLKSTVQSNNDQLLGSFLHEIPSIVDTDRELTIVQDMKNKCWRLVVDDQFLQKLENDKIKTNVLAQSYSITKKYDPNILYRMLTFDETYSIPFEYKFEFDLSPISIYTTRKFSTYLHEVINE
jgi:hypothetical protein